MDVYRASDSIFLNSKAMIVEYHDVIKSPWIALLISLIGDSDANTIFDFSEFKSVKGPKHLLNHLVVWYINRRNINFLRDLKIRDEFKNVPDEFYANMLYNFTYNNPSIFKFPMHPLNMANVIANLISWRIVSNIYIYNEIKSDLVENDIKTIFPRDVKFISGNFDEVVKAMPNDSTYVFSDITKINTLIETDHIGFSSILIADGYGYNFDMDGKPKVDVEYIKDKYHCKIDFFDNVHAHRGWANGTKRDNKGNTANEGKETI